MLKLIKDNWAKLADQLAGKKLYWFKSPSGILLLGATEKILNKYCRGKVLDVGAGRLAYKSLLEKHCEEYKSIDFKATSPELDFVGDVQDMEVLNDDQFDTVFCSQVLEHIPEPQKAMNEISRILKRGGKAIISVPFLGYLHNEPYDFFRYTKHSLRFISKRAGFEVVEINEVGGLFSFLGYIWSTFFIGLFAGIPFLGYIVLLVNIPLSYFFILLDVVTMNKKLMPLNYLFILKKRDV
ncbi:MAG: methyltransferase domain-containing protein [Patescibacteria group bacterium]|nr:methyltransferase domain-containing protein [Patescibacteria group bacterium]